MYDDPDSIDNDPQKYFIEPKQDTQGDVDEEEVNSDDMDVEQPVISFPDYQETDDPIRKAETYEY